MDARGGGGVVSAHEERSFRPQDSHATGNEVGGEEFGLGGRESRKVSRVGGKEGPVC